MQGKPACENPYMGQTQYVTVGVREYALLCRLEGQVRCLLREQHTYSDTPARMALDQTMQTLVKLRRQRKAA